MLKFARILPMLLLLTTLTGCWDFREVHQITFISTIGVDYKNKEYILYAQALNFADIAQREGERPPKHRAVIGQAAGATVTDAMFNLYKTEQSILYWGHISAIIFSKQALEQIKVEQLVDSVNRFRELRYNVWVYATDEPIDKLLNASPPFGHSPYDSRLMKPTQTYRQFSNIKPIYLNRFVSDYFERGKSVLVPKLSIDSSTWSEGGERLPELRMEGVYVLSSRAFSGTLTDEQLSGKRYLNQKSVRMPVILRRNGRPAVLFVINNPRVRVNHSVSGDTVYLDLSIRFSGYIDEMLQDVTAGWMREQIEQTVEKEIRETFENGRRINADVLNLTTSLYRRHYKTWQRYVTDRLDMSKIELRQIKISFNIKNSGKYKARIQ